MKQLTILFVSIIFVGCGLNSAEPIAEKPKQVKGFGNGCCVNFTIKNGVKSENDRRGDSSGEISGKK